MQSKWLGALAPTICALAFFACASSAAAQMVLEVIPLRYRTAEELIVVLQPMLARDTSLSGLGGQLVVRTTRANLAELRRVLSSIDLPPRRLQVTVAQEIAADGRRRAADASGALRIDDELRFGVRPQNGPRDEIQVRVYDTRSIANVTVLQTVQVLEGRSAYVQTGQAWLAPDRPVTHSIATGHFVEQALGGVDYVNLETGFYVLPRVSGDRVTVGISPQRETLIAQRPGALDAQYVATTVSGRLGEWLELAAVSQERRGERDVLLGRAGGVRSQSRSVLLRIDELR